MIIGQNLTLADFLTPAGFCPGRSISNLKILQEFVFIISTSDLIFFSHIFVLFKKNGKFPPLGPLQCDFFLFICGMIGAEIQTKTKFELGQRIYMQKFLRYFLRFLAEILYLARMCSKFIKKKIPVNLVLDFGNQGACFQKNN